MLAGVTARATALDGWSVIHRASLIFAWLVVDKGRSLVFAVGDDPPPRDQGLSNGQFRSGGEDPFTSYRNSQDIAGGWISLVVAMFQCLGESHGNGSRLFRIAPVPPPPVGPMAALQV